MLSRRLQMIADMVEPGVVLADIGSDHALLVIDLLQRKTIERACACDVAPGPLSSAEENIRNAGLTRAAETILSDGFKNVPMECDGAVIAGMGFYTAAKILEEADGKLDHYKQIIVQVNHDSELMRRWLSEREWRIVDEEIIEDRGFYYEALSILPHGGRELSLTEIVAGPILMQRRSEAFLKHARNESKRLEEIIEKRGRMDEKQKDLLQHLSIWNNILQQ